MTTLTAPDEASISTSNKPRAPRLCLRRSGRADQSIELRNGKCTIGSSPRCHVCLPASEAQPLQCLLSLEAGAAIVTRWASGVLLNGHSFAKQEFQMGDRLSIGPWEIEWEARSAAPRSPSNLRETVEFTPPPTAAPMGNLRPTEPFEAPVATATAPEAAIKPNPAEQIAASMPVARAAVTVAETEVTLASPAAPVAATRPAAKTMLISSRQTDPFAALLGPSKPIVPVAAVASPASPAPAARPSFTSQAFEDRLVASLWAANFAARRRAKALATSARAARVRTSELVAAVTELERRVASDRSISNAAATAQQSQLESLRAELSQSLAERVAIAAELEALRTARPGTSPPDPRLQTLADASAKAEREAAELREALAACQEQIETLREQRLAAESALSSATVAQVAAAKAQSSAEQQLAELTSAADARHRDAMQAETKSREQERLIADQEAARLREQLYACESQIETFRSQLAEMDAARSALDAQVAALQQQQTDWLSQCQTLELDRASTLAAVTGERDELQRQLDELAASPAAAILASPAATSWTAPAIEFADEAEESDANPVALTAAENEPASAVGGWRGWEHAETLAAEGQKANSHAAYVESELAKPEFAGSDFIETVDEADDLSVEEQELVAVEPIRPALVSEPTPVPEKPFAPPSFIDKYRHLLDDEGESVPTPPASRRILDEEHMSPAKAMLGGVRDEDSDEALEAYMSNMMRRVRGGESAPASQAPVKSHSPAPAAAAEAQAEDVTPTIAVEEPEIEVDANGMLRLVRKQPHAATDMSALRELANSSARTAIAHHRQRRHVESAVTKGAVCAVASGASAYLLLTSTGMESPWFWGGCVTMVLAVASAGQLGVLAWQRLKEGRRAAAMAIAAAGETHADFGQAGVTPKA